MPNCHGRVATTEIVNPENGQVMYPASTLLDEDAVDAIEAVGLDEVKVRTPLTCDTRYGLCAKCYGRDLGRGSRGGAGLVGAAANALLRRAWLDQAAAG